MKVQSVLESLGPTIDEWTGQGLIARKLGELLGIQCVQIVPGDCDENPAVKSLIGKEAATEFMNRIDGGRIIAVTGGSSVAAIPRHIHSIRRSRSVALHCRQGWRRR